MEAKELRIGNTVWLRSKSKAWIIGDGYEIDTGIESEDFEPIPISSKLLLSVGFTHDYGENYSYKEESDDEIYFCIICRADGWLFYIHNEIKNFSTELSLINALHELQNIMFDIAKIELIYVEKA